MSDVMRLQAQINELQDQVKYLLTLEQPGAWVDYTATSTITGWAAGYTASIRYLKERRRMTVVVGIVGVSNSASATITLPFVCGAATYVNYAYIMDNGVWAHGNAQIYGPSSTLKFYPSATSTNTWTASGNKRVYTVTVYETA